MAEMRMEQLLKWPEPTEHYDRPSGPFRVGIYKTDQFLREELHKIYARNIVLRTFHPEVAHRRDGGIRVDAKAPLHPGVVLEFEKPQLDDNGDVLGWTKMRLPCDTYRQWEDNLRAVAMVLEGLRMIDRHEICAGAQYQGYMALPPAPGVMTIEDALDFLAEKAAVPRSALLQSVDVDEFCYKKAAKVLHPDKGGDDKEFAKLETAISLIRGHYQEAAA